jgi:hypothetical protein
MAVKGFIVQAKKSERIVALKDFALVKVTEKGYLHRTGI